MHGIDGGRLDKQTSEACCLPYFYWYQIDMPRSDIQNPKLSSDGRNLYLVGVEPVNPYGLLIYRLQPYGGFAEMGN